MILQLWIRDDETGIIDGENRDGDIEATKLDAEQATIGGIEKKTFLFAKVPDPPAGIISKFRDELDTPEYLPASDTGEKPQIRHKTKYRVDWRKRFTQAEIAIIEDATQTLPDGPTTSGNGTVVAGVVEGLFTLQDILRK